MASTPERDGQKWTREEIILAFDLYCRIPFGKINLRNQDIIDLAAILKRTPGAVSLKMSNLARFDPVLQSRNVSGMANGSKLDGEVFHEFYCNLEALAYQAWQIKKRMGINGLPEAPEFSDLDKIPPGEYREQLIRERMGQHAFRMSVLNSFNNRCCVTGLSLPNLLIASHIKPWAACSEGAERTNPHNGLCLNAFHDRAFDQGFITIDKNFKVIISSQLLNAKVDDATKAWISGYGGETIILPERFAPAKEFIEYHNDVIFIP